MYSVSSTFRPGTGLVRALVVATATLAILLVCFSIYQFSQFDPVLEAKVANPRMPQTPPPGSAVAGDQTVADASGVRMDQVLVGPGEGVNLSLYRPGSSSAFGEIAFRRWEPVPGSPDELLVIEPEIRLRTKDGNGIRVTASEAVLEGDLKVGLNLKRGRMRDRVLIEYDRLTQEDRANLPPERCSTIDPDDIVRIDLEELDFDLEYSKVSVPRGEVHLSARDVDFRAQDMEIRFNERESRVDYMRISRGGRIELRELSDELGMSMPGVSPEPARKFTLVDWLRTTVQASLDAQPAQQPEEEPPPSSDAVAVTEDGVPVFRANAGQEDKPARVVKYLAHFEKDVDARQMVGQRVQSRLQADALDVFRVLSEAERNRVRTKGDAATADVEQLAEPPDERVYLQWSGRLVVETVQPDDMRWPENMQAKIIATGSPVHISNADGDAACSKLTLDPEGSKVWLTGDEGRPVVIRSAQQGTMTGVETYTERDGDNLYMRVAGPGTLQRGGDADDEAGTASPRGGQPLTVEFSNQLEAHGRFVTKRRVDFAGGISSKTVRVIDRASFLGQVVMTQGDTNLSADALDLSFDSKRGWRDDEQTIERVVAKGHVLMKEGDDHLRAREVDLVLTTDRDGGVVPLTATALTDVEAVQNQRTIRASNKLIVDFAMVSRPAPPFDAFAAHAEAVRAGLNVSEIDWEVRRREHDAKGRQEAGVKRLQAFGEVTVTDPSQALDLSADKLDCSVIAGREIDTALVTGTDGHPASVHLDTFTVTGEEINLKVPDQWAHVPGGGRLTFRSHKDLDGRKSDEPIPIAIEWQDWMKYQGRENRAVFSGEVHAYSRTTTEFDCQQLLVEFDDVAAAPEDGERRQDWWIFQDIVDSLGRDESASGSRLADEGFSKEPAYILATGNAIALTSEIDPSTDALKSRARLFGPKLSVDLRREVSKMLIEGPGNLLLEDFRPMAASLETEARPAKGLFDVDRDSGPSKTLIQWHELMWYDFSIDQTRFEGDVVLKHFSGAELSRIMAARDGSSDIGAGTGRSTHLKCDVLTADFLGREDRAQRLRTRRMGRLSAEQLRQFQATGSVMIQDDTEGLYVTADRVKYERDRDILVIHGSPQRDAQIVVQKPGELPTQVTAERMFLDLETGKIEAAGTTIKGR